MAKRKSMNRRLSRYKRSSAVSAILDPDMDIVDDNEAFWWKNLENNTMRYSTRARVFNETSRHLDSAFSTGEIERGETGNNSTQWWKILDDSKSVTAVRDISNKAETSKLRAEPGSHTLESSDSAPEEEIRIKRRKLPLRKVARRESGNENAFLKALNSSKESVVSQPSVKISRTEFRNNFALVNSIRASSEPKLSPAERSEEHTANQSQTVTDIVKVRPTIFGKRQANQNKNIFEEVLNNTDESSLKSPFKTPSKVPPKSKPSTSSSKSKIEPQNDIASSTPIRKNRRSRLTLSFDNNTDESLKLPDPKAQSTIIETTPLVARKSSDSDTSIKIFKPKTRMLNRLRKSLKSNVFEDILKEDSNENSITNMNNQKETSDSNINISKDSLSDVIVNEEKLAEDLVTNKRRTLRGVSDKAAEESVKTTEKSLVESTSTFGDTSKKANSSKAFDKEIEENTERDEERQSTSEQNDVSVRSKRSTSRNRDERVTLSAIMDEQTEENLRKNQIPDELVETRIRTDVELLNTSKQSKTSVRSERSILGTRGKPTNLSAIVGEQGESSFQSNAENSNTSKLNETPVKNKRSTSGNKSKRTTSNKILDESMEERTATNVEFSDISKQSDASVRSKRSTLGNRSKRRTFNANMGEQGAENLRNRVPEETVQENTRTDVELPDTAKQRDASTRNKRSTIGNTSAKTTLDKISEGMVEESMRTDVELPNTSKQSNASVRSKRSTLGNRGRRTTLNVVVDEQADDMLRESAEHLSSSKPNNLSAKNKSSTLRKRNRRATSKKTRVQMVEEVTRTDVELLNTMGQSHLQFESERSPSSRTSRMHLDASSDELYCVSKSATASNLNEVNDKEGTQAEYTGSVEIGAYSDSDEIPNSMESLKLSVSRKCSSSSDDVSITEALRPIRKENDNPQERIGQSDLTEDSDGEQDKQDRTKVDHAEQEKRFEQADKRKAVVNKTRRETSTRSGKKSARYSVQLTAGNFTSGDANSDINVVDVSDDERPLTIAQEHDDLQSSSPPPVHSASQSAAIQPAPPRAPSPQRFKTLNARKKVLEEGSRRESPRQSTGTNENKKPNEFRSSIPNLLKKSISSSRPSLSKMQPTIDNFFRERTASKMSQALSSNEEAQQFKKKLEDIKKRAIESVEAKLQSKREDTPKPRKQNRLKVTAKLFGNNVSKKKSQEVNKAYLVNGKVYKPPRLPRPKPWVTDRLYRFLWKALEPKYGVSTRVQSEKFVVQLADAVTTIRKQKKYAKYKALLDNLMKEMARIGIITTPVDFYHFAYDFLPNEFWAKVTPMLLPGNEKNIPYNISTLCEPLLDT